MYASTSDCSASASIRRAPSRTISSISDDEPSFPPAWPEPSPGTTVSIGLYLPGRRANAGHCLRASTTRSPGRYTPFPADPQVSSIAPVKGISPDAPLQSVLQRKLDAVIAEQEERARIARGP